MNDKI